MYVWVCTCIQESKCVYVFVCVHRHACTSVWFKEIHCWPSYMQCNFDFGVYLTLAWGLLNWFSYTLDPALHLVSRGFNCLIHNVQEGRGVFNRAKGCVLAFSREEGVCLSIFSRVEMGVSSFSRVERAHPLAERKGARLNLQQEERGMS